MSLEPRQRAFLVLAHEARVAGDVGGKDGCEPAHDLLPNASTPRAVGPRKSLYLLGKTSRHAALRSASAASIAFDQHAKERSMFCN
jgi:hypothetical protein